MNRKLSILTGTALIVTAFFGGFGVASAAVTISASTIAGETATIDMTDFDVSADGLVVTGPDAAGDSFTTTLTAGASQALVVTATAAMTETAGIIDLDVNAGVADGVDAIDIAVTQNDGATATHDARGMVILLTQNDADGDMFGITITAAATTNATTASYEAAITIDNAENTAASMTDGILITSSGIDAGITDAIDVSASNIANAINIGANAIAGTNFSVTGAGVITATGLADSGTLSVTGLSSLGQATSTMLSAHSAYFGMSASTTFSTAGAMTLPNSSTAVSGIVFGFCNIANSASITASSSAYFNCTGATGVTTSHRVFIQATSSLPGNLLVQAASSTANDTINLLIYNPGHTGALAPGAISLNFFGIR